jgi:hypothetical protein
MCGPKGREEFKDEAVSCAEFLQQWMRSYIHNVTGRLSRAIEAGAYRAEIPAAYLRVDYNIAPHAHLVEFGTVHMGAKSYFRRGIDVAAPMILSRIERKAELIAARGGAK